MYVSPVDGALLASPVGLPPGDGQYADPPRRKRTGLENNAG